MEQSKEGLNHKSSEINVEHPQSIHKTPSKIGFLKTLLLLVGFICAFILGGIGGYFLGLKSKVTETSQKNDSVSEPTSQIRPTKASDTSTFPSLDEITIIDGSVYGTLSSGEKKLLFDKEDFRINTERYYSQPDNYPERKDPFFNFSQVSLSPDKTKILLLAQGSLTLDYIYYASANGDSVIGLSLASEAAWSNNSRYIAYANKPADAGPIIRVYIYDTQTHQQTDISSNYTIGESDHNYLGFNNLRWLDDDSGIKIEYEAYKGELPYGEKVGEGETILTFNE